MDDYFNFFPDYGIIFLDTCALGISVGDKEKAGRIERKKDHTLINISKMNKLRTSYLIEKLSNIDNWYMVKEVIEEFEFGIEGFKELFRRTISGSLSAVIRKEISERESLLRQLKQKYRNPFIDLNHRLVERSSLLKEIEDVFIGKGGKIDKRNTDCRLILAGVVCAENENAYIFSIDSSLLRTYASCSVELGLQLKGTYILDEQKKGIISTQQYWLDHCQ